MYRLSQALQAIDKKYEILKKPQRVWVKPEELDMLTDDGKIVNSFLRLFSKFASIYHLKRTRSNDFVLQMNAQFKKKLQFFYQFLTSIENGKGIYLFGGYGTGKSMTVFALAEILKLFNNDFEYSFIRSSKLIDKYIKLSESKDYVGFEEFKFKQLLIIDDLGAEPSHRVKTFGNEVRPLDDIISHRYDRGLWTWFTSNYSLDQLAQKYDGYIIDRLKQMCYFIEFNWESYRK